MTASSSEREEARLRALHDQAILDTPPEATFDDLAYLAAEVSGTPDALITFVDRHRQWFKARVGAGAREWPRSAGFCPLTIEQDGLLVVPDAFADVSMRERAAAAADLPGRFYAGVPLVTADGHNIGALGVLDHVPRELQAWQRGALGMLARLVMRELQIRQARRDLDRRKTEAVGTLAGGLAHELYGLLAALQEQESLLSVRLPPDDPCRAALRRGLEGARRAAELTRELLSVGRHSGAAPRTLDLNELITHLEPEWRALLGDDVRLRLRLVPELGRVKADPDQIGRALRCAVESARVDLPCGADLMIATESLETEGDPEGRRVAVSIGHPEPAGAPEEPDPIGGPHRDAAAGSSLELHAVHGLVAQHGGRIHWRSRPGSGTRIRIVLPAVPAGDA